MKSKDKRKTSEDFNKERNRRKKKGGATSLLDLILRREKKNYTVENTIPYLRMLKTGICQVDERHYNKMIEFNDINYQLALEEDRDLIFNQFANFLNSFDLSISVEFTYVNQFGRNQVLEAAIRMQWTSVFLRKENGSSRLVILEKIDLILKIWKSKSREISWSSLTKKLRNSTR